jgi:hypothetical protein
MPSVPWALRINLYQRGPISEHSESQWKLLVVLHSYHHNDIFFFCGADSYTELDLVLNPQPSSRSSCKAPLPGADRLFNVLKVAMYLSFF